MYPSLILSPYPINERPKKFVCELEFDLCKYEAKIGTIFVDSCAFLKVSTILIKNKK